tara:strand:+ start:465 stop:1043 length:579 start_codon:yes stop_codon:yes gene_type:complete
MFDRFQEFLLNTIIVFENLHVLYSSSAVIISSIILYSFPIPGSIILIFHVIFFGLFGFITSIFCSTTSSILLYLFFKKFIKIKTLDKFKFLNQFTSNIYVLTLSRIFIPFPICSYALIILKIKFKKYIIATIIGSIPGTLSITLLLNSLKANLLKEGQIQISVFKDPYFLLSIVFVFTLLFLSSKFKKKYFI